MAMVLAAIFATRMRDQPTKGADAAKLMAGVLDGLRYTLNHVGIRLVLALLFCVSLFVKPYMDLLPGYGLAVFGYGTDGVGTMVAASGVGALCISVFMALRGRTKGLTRVLINLPPPNPAL